jgi:hypothetical protein
MRKKKLVLENLVVESFDSAPPPLADRGTVRGYLSGQYGPACASEYPNCDPSGAYGPDCASEWPNCGYGQTDRCV